MPGDTPITTATARLLIDPDLSAFDEAKRKIESDIDALGEKFKGAFTVNIEDITEKLKAVLDRVEAATGGGNDQQPQARADDRIDNKPDQLLAKVTELQSQVSRIEQSLEDISQALTAGGP